MRLLIQRVRRASVTIDGTLHSSIGAGLLLLVGIEEADTQEDIDYLAGKASRLRVFDDEAGVMNLDVRRTRWISRRMVRRRYGRRRPRGCRRRGRGP